MHIPDGYLSPATCGVLGALMIPIWMRASKMVQKTLKAKQVPMLAISSAFSFVIMMFNIPIPGGSTGHAVGAVLAAIILGPWATTISLTVALVIQAILFGDGGITALGANAFNMAFIMPFTGYYTYRLFAGKTKNDQRKILAAGIAGFCGINAAALATGIELGLQPLLFHTAQGQALYCPYGLKIAVGTMLGEHLLLFGWVEGLVTSLSLMYLLRHSPDALPEKVTA